MSNPETELYGKFISIFSNVCRKRDLRHTVTRIESNLTSQGIPDLNVCVEGHEFWVECKVNDKLSAMQQSWHRQRREAGGKVFIINQLDNKYELSNELPGAHILSYYPTMNDVADEILEEVLG